MTNFLLYAFIAIMWVLMLAGGGILVTMVSKITISGYGDEMDFFIASIIKAIIALVFVVFWIIILSKLKNKVFQKQLKP